MSKADNEPIGRIDAIERAICRERCAQMGEPACWQAAPNDWPNPECKGPDCRSLACAAEEAVRCTPPLVLWTTNNQPPATYLPPAPRPNVAANERARDEYRRARNAT